MKRVTKNMRDRFARVAWIQLRADRDADDLRSGLEAIIAYNLLGDEGFCELGDVSIFVNENRSLVEALISEAFSTALDRIKAGDR
jgi:hypothetical protein